MADERPYGLKILKNAMAPLCNDDATLRQLGPYQPVLDACELCPARCCRLTVKVSLPDAVTFCNTLGLPFFSGLTLVPGAGARSFEVENDLRVNPHIEEWPGRAEIALRRRDDGACGMLIDIGGYDRCGVYSARPSTCRLYPMAWTSEVAQGGPGLVMCPVPYGVTPAMEEQFFADAERSIGRWQIHDQVLAEWHADEPEDGRTMETFIKFAIPRTADLIGEGHEKVLAEGGPMDRLYDGMKRAGLLR